MNNISKYVQLNDFLLLEYEFSKDGSTSVLAASLDASNNP